MLDQGSCTADMASLSAAVAGDRQAGDAFARRWRDPMRTWLWFRWRHSPLRSLVDDAVQEVFIECLRPGGALDHLDTAQAAHGLRAYLRGVVGNVAHRIERREARSFNRQRRLAIGVERPARPDAGEVLDLAQTHDQIAHALDLVDGEDDPRAEHPLRDFLRLHFEEGLPVRAIAKRWHDSPEHVHEIRRRACRRLRNCLLRVLHHHAMADQTGHAMQSQ